MRASTTIRLRNTPSIRRYGAANLMIRRKVPGGSFRFVTELSLMSDRMPTAPWIPI
jgi:hypothetical protein